MSTSKRLDSVRDSIASLFKRSPRNGSKSSSERAGDSGGGVNDGGRNISTPQNVKRVMHITFNAGNQGFDGIPEQWRQYFEAQPEAVASTAQSPSSLPQAVAPRAGAAPMATMSIIQEEPAEEERAAIVEPMTSEDSSSDVQEPADTTELAQSQQRADDLVNVDVDDDEVGPPPPPMQPRQPRELLSLVYDRNTGQFVNLPPHWEDRLERNNLLAPEFHANPQLLPVVFSLMDQELRAMREEGARVESGLFSSPSTQRRQTSPESAEPGSATGSAPAYVFQIEAEKSNSSSELDLLNDEQREEELLHRHSLVTVRAVEVPEDIIENTRL